MPSKFLALILFASAGLSASAATLSFPPGYVPSNASIELAPGHFFSHVLVPTSAEQQGDFRDFGGPVIDPMTGMPFPGNIIAEDRLFELYAFRVQVGAPAAAPEPAGFGIAGLDVLSLLFWKRSRRA